MSARMLQRALRNNIRAEVAPGIHTTKSSSDRDRTSDSEEDGSLGQESVSNPFDLLGLQEDAEDENDVDGDAGRESNNQESTSATAVVPSKAKSKKHKGKKKKKKGSKEANSSEKSVVVDDDGDLVHSLLERSVVGTAGEGSSSTSGGAPYQGREQHRPNILAVDTKFLRAEDELRRIFGSKVIDSVDRRTEAEGGAHRRRQAGTTRRSRRGMPLRKSVLVVPMEHWARWDGGMTMDCTKVEGRIQYFRYQYLSSYQEVQKHFETCVASHDPNTIVMLLRTNPYHVDSLLALAEVYKQMGEHQQSADLLERALYALECAWHPWFSSALGTCRLDFSCDTNKALFLSLFRHMQHLGRRGCHRTALEVCKLLLSLDPSDPLGALFCIDYFALRAEQYEWLERFVDEYDSDTPISLLPNFSFSVAVACFYLEDQQSHRRNVTSSNVKRATSSKENNVSSGDLLQQALMLHPSVLKKILEKASIKEDYSWAKIVTHSHFSKANGGGPTLDHLISIYVERNYLIWRSPELQGWLKEASAVVTQIADKGFDSNSSSEIANWECIRKEVFQSKDNEYEHLHVFEFSDSTSTLPPEEMPQLGFHPHGGFAEEHMALVRDDPTALDEGQLQQAVHQVASMQGRNGLLHFLQSLVPWIDYRGEAPVDEAPTLLEESNEEDDSVARDGR